MLITYSGETTINYYLWATVGPFKVNFMSSPLKLASRKLSPLLARVSVMTPRFADEGKQ